jgi:quercetin dioxygenase-like cupin family protein
MPEPKFIFHPDESVSEFVDLGGQGVDFKVHAEHTEGRVSIVEHPIEPGRLVPAHCHHNEDELSYVLEGEIGVKIGDFEGSAGPGCYIWKPRNIGHTVWNATSKWVKVIEIIVPGGFEKFFKEVAEFSKLPGAPHIERRRELGKKYNLEYLPEWAPELMKRYNLKLLGQK